MRSMEAYPRAAMERAMKVQDVMLQAMAKKITWWQAAEILGISDRHMRRWRERYVEEGYNGLFDRRRGKPSRRRVKRHSVCKRWTIEKADENSNGIPWFVLRRPNSDKLRFRLPSLPWHECDA